MTIPLEQHLPYRALAIALLALFYAIYFGKMLAQRRQGIQTNQIAKRKHGTVLRIESLMAAATYSIVAVQLLSIALGWSVLPPNARLTGFLLGLIGDLIFLVSVLSMKDSWRAGIPDQDETKLVTGGIYAFSRNPAFLGFDLMYCGVLLLFANILLLVFTVFAIVMLHLQILQEEQFMEQRFGASYIQYKRKVCRYLGRK